MRQPQAGAIQPVQVRSKLKGGVLLGSECCVATGDSGCEAYTFAGIRLRRLLAHRDEQVRIEFSVAIGGAADMDGRAAQPETGPELT